MKAHSLSLLFAAHLSFFLNPSSSRAIPFSSGVNSKPKHAPANNHCDCYLVSGPDPGYFQHYEFYDFRNVPLDLYQATDPVPPGNVTKPRLKDGVDSDGQADNTTKLIFGPDTVLLSQTPFARFWKPQSWRRRRSAISPVPMVNSIDNVFFARDPNRLNGPNSTFLVFRTVRRENHTSAAEIESSIHNLYHSSVRVRLRIFVADPRVDSFTNFTIGDTRLPPPGACAGIFTYNSAICESDIEILTVDPPNHVHYANQPDYDPISDTVIPGASAIAHIDVPWTSWATHRIDWFSWISRWYENDELLHSTRYSIPDKLSMLVINLWSDGGNWSGDLNLGENVFMGVEWIEIAYNVSSADLHGEPVGKPSQRHAHRPYRIQGREELVDVDEEGAVDEAVEDEVVVGVKKRDGSTKSCSRPCWVDGFHR